MREGSRNQCQLEICCSFIKLACKVDQAEYTKNFIVGKGTYLVAYHYEGYTNIIYKRCREVYDQAIVQIEDRSSLNRQKSGG